MKTLKQLTDEVVNEADADIMNWVYEIVEINFDATLVQDSTELRRIIHSFLSRYAKNLLKEVGGQIQGVIKDLKNEV